MVVRMRATKSHRNNRRSHHKLANPPLAQCECGAMHIRHRMCQACGKYRGRIVVAGKAVAAPAEKVPAVKKVAAKKETKKAAPKKKTSK